ncbi:MAG: hypothetical protein ACYDH4_10505 [Candidatus Cryosericum sp.]
MPRQITRGFILNLMQSCPAADSSLTAWRRGELTFEEAMMTVVKDLFLANEELQRQITHPQSHGKPDWGA